MESSLLPTRALDHNQKMIYQVLFISNGYLWKQLDHMRKTITDDLIQQTKRRVSIMILWKI
jgi:hypothetical protein